MTTDVVIGSLTDTYPTAAPSTPNGVGPGLVLAEDNTLGPYSPYQGRIYAAFVGYFNVSTRGHSKPDHEHRHLPGVLRRRRSDLEQPRSSSTTTRRPPTAIARRTIQSRQRQRPDITGRTQFSRRSRSTSRPEPWSLVARRPRRRRQCPGRDLHHHQHRRRPDLRPPDLRQPGQDGRRRDYRRRPTSSGRRQMTSRRPMARRDAPFGYGNQMGLAVADGQLFPIWAGNFCGPNAASIPRQLLQLHHRCSQCLSAEHLVSADDHRGRAANHLEHDGSRY